MESWIIRESFIEYFKNKYNHQYIQSSRLIMPEDPGLLFVNAGMCQFKDVFLNRKKAENKRVVNSQRCIRVSGKHNDLEEVGHDTYHHTFFEMLGNWSFDDYYKEETIKWCWELLTKEWKLPKERLHATVFAGDESKNVPRDTEAFEFWKKVTDIDESHIHYFGSEDNFWSMGATGPCGPSSEIHIDLTPDLSGKSLVNKGVPTVIELWNLVFIQYNMDEHGELSNLASKHIDTGMGFERIAAVLQKKNSNYDTDIFTPIINSVSDLTGIKYTGQIDDLSDVSFRVISDHIRMAAFAISDGVIPGNKGRGYVVRGIIRRMVRFYYQYLKRKDPFLYQLIPIIINQLGGIFPSIVNNQEKISSFIKKEEEDFLTTINRGISIFREAADKALNDKGIINGETVFDLYTTYGFPYELTKQMARELKLSIDEKLYLEMMNEHRIISGKKNKFSNISLLKGDIAPTNDIQKYSTQECESIIRGWIIDNHFLNEGKLDKDEKAILITDETCFYAESGGQGGDTGEITTDTGKFIVSETQKSGDSIYHIGHVKEGYFQYNQKAKLKVDNSREQMSRNHTCTHLLHYALHQVIGDIAEQQGSKIKTDSFTFDFISKKQVNAKQLIEIENNVNDLIRKNLPVKKYEMKLEEARKFDDIRAFFGDKYENIVRVVDIGEGTSRELCGGPHVESTGKIGLFIIIKEESIAKGIRRMTCKTGVHALQFMQNMRSILDTIRIKYKCQYDEVVTNLETTEGRLKELEKTIKQLSINEINKEISKLYESKKVIKDVNVVVGQIKSDFPGNLWQCLNDFVATHSKVVFIIGNIQNDQKAQIIGMASEDLEKSRIDCSKIVSTISKQIGGGGGGKLLKARGSGTKSQLLPNVLKNTEDLISKQLQN